MKWWRRLDTRLFASYAAVAAAGTTVVLVTTRLLVPRLFDNRMGAGPGVGPGGRGPTMHSALVAALDRALLVAVAASLAVAAAIAVLVARRLLRPIDQVRAATRRLAAGHYDERVEPPSEPELAGLAADVNALAQSLADTEQRRAQLVSDVAHELRTPLTTIRGYTEGMLDGVVEPDQQVLTAVLSEVDRLQRLAGDLSTLSRADEGALSLVPVPVDLISLAANVVGGFQAAAGQKGVGLEFHAGSEQVGITADPDRVAQVIANLVANAITYTPAGGRVTVDVSADEQRCALTVRDSGVGLAAGDHERVFDRFYRVEGVERPPGGSGIGLAIARAIARAHGGELTAASAGPGQGSTFTLRLPSQFLSR